MMVTNTLKHSKTISAMRVNTGVAMGTIRRKYDIAISTLTGAAVAVLE